MNIFDAIKTLDIQENSSNLEGSILSTLATSVAKPDSVFVEIGTWKGKTAAMLASVAQNCNGTVYTIDHFMGNKGTGMDFVALKIDLFNIFKHNMQALGFWQTVVKPLVMDSTSANKLFKDNCIDLLFIDGDHLYEPFYNELVNWYPKVKTGGIICGHDCQEYYIDFPEEVDGKYKTIDCGVSEKYGKQVHYAVIKAVHEYFKGDYKIVKPTSIWWRRK
jgi:hypothetical protein